MSVVLPFELKGEEDNYSERNKSARISVFGEQAAFSLVSELSVNRQDYSGGENMSISGMPNYVIMALERLRHRVAKPLISVSPTIACCIQKGLESIKDHKDIKNLLALRHEFHIRDASDNELTDSIHLLFKRIPLGIPDVGMLGSDSISVRIPEDIKSKLGLKASGIGIAVSRLAVVCIIEVLKNQQHVSSRHKTYMIDSLKGFMGRLKTHRDILESLIDILSRKDGEFSISGIKSVANRLATELGQMLNELNTEERARAEQVIEACKAFTEITE